MIDRVFWDIDETLIHTETRPFGPGYNDVAFELDDSTYYTKIRPCSNELVNFSRNLVGSNNVYILTTATRDYAHEINRIAGWGFEHNHIFSREDLYEHRYNIGYGSTVTAQHKTVSSQNNVLIDNLPHRVNFNKMCFIGINHTRYLEIDDYYGVEYSDSTFMNDVKEFLTNLHTNG
jgi:hypothetical protein